MTDPKATAMVLTEAEIGALKELVRKNLDSGPGLTPRDCNLMDRLSDGDVPNSYGPLFATIDASRQQVEDSCAREKAMRSEADKAQAGRMEWFNKYNSLLDRVRVLEGNQRTAGTIEVCAGCRCDNSMWCRSDTTTLGRSCPIRRAAVTGEKQV